MSVQYYRDRAAEARRDADAATLDNVRERCLRSETAFLAMASRAERSTKMRERLETEKAEALQQAAATSPPMLQPIE
jgi:hypothetical protein